MEFIDYTQARERFVRKSNELIQRARHHLSLRQNKMILYLISRINPFEDDYLKPISFSITDFCRTVGITSQSQNYADLKQELRKLADKSCWLTFDNGDTETLVRWIDRLTIRRKSGTIEVKLNDDLAPYLLNLRKCYTEFQLIFVLGLSHRRSLILYENMCAIHYNKLEEYKKIYTIDELRYILDAESYKEYKYFIRDVLKPSILEINKNSDINIFYKSIKQGKKVTAIELTVSSKKSLNKLAIADRLNKQLGLNPDTVTLYDELKQKEYI